MSEYKTKYVDIQAFLDSENRNNVYDHRDLMEKLEAFPAADVEPVVRGYYVIDEMGDSSCSVCGENWLNVTHKRCPNCGAYLERSGSGE